MEESKGKKFTNWLQDSLQAIIVIIIALFILFFLIYSYAKKSNHKEAMIDNDNAKKEELLAEIPADENGNSKEELVNNSENSKKDSLNNQDVVNVDRGKGPSSSSVETEKQSQSYKTEGGINIEVSRGDSLTTLARKVTAQYISENNVEDLTPAHKIYIEDYLQKKEKNKTVNVGDSVSFSNDSINLAIQSAKSLNARQLQHLNIYANHVKGL